MSESGGLVLYLVGHVTLVGLNITFPKKLWTAYVKKVKYMVIMW